MVIKTDAGFRSRKWAAFVLTSVAIVGVGCALGPEKSREVIFGLVSALAIYLGGNVSQGWVDAKHGKLPQMNQDAPAPAGKPPAPGQPGKPSDEEEGS